MGTINDHICVGNSWNKIVQLKTTCLKNNVDTRNESFFLFSFLDSTYHKEHFDIWYMYIAFVKLLKIVFVIVYVFVECIFRMKNNNKDKGTILSSYENDTYVYHISKCSL